MDPRFEQLQGLRILVVEDDFLIVAELEDILNELNCTIVGPFASMSDATDACRQDGLDGAVLDMNLRGESILPAVEILAAKQVPFILATGYPSRSSDNEVLKSARRVSKPFDLQSLGNAMADVFSGEAGPSARRPSEQV